MKLTKLFLAASILIIPAQAMAIEFITEDQVAQTLEAQKVIEISKYSVESLLEEGSDCASVFNSKSARAYVVKKDGNASIYITASGLKSLIACKSLSN
ncbi:MAG: hypothetical protein EOP11_04115 [Proteobacteria bacterium]|nr:MAG: hypothetical protein EOP11_04115 [Pseudomonadota bacterium]